MLNRKMRNIHPGEILREEVIQSQWAYHNLSGQNAWRYPDGFVECA
jgi:hypothetical protein